MIHYSLRCATGHEFEGWFKSSSAFDQQAGAGLVDCPVCASTEVTRALMAPRIGRALAAPAPVETPSVAAEPAQTESTAMAVGGAPAMPDQVRAVLQRIRAEVEQKCDYVGPKFADVARAMHEGQTPPRPIYGETTPDQAEALAEDGIDVARIPWVPRADG
jgi:hypothetical protein